VRTNRDESEKVCETVLPSINQPIVSVQLDCLTKVCTRECMQEYVEKIYNMSFGPKRSPDKLRCSQAANAYVEHTCEERPSS